MKYLFAVVFAFLMSMLPGFASAATAFDPLTNAVTFTDVIAAIMSVAAVLAGLYVTMRGVNVVLGFIRR